MLGIKWLETLGPIMWNFASLIMSFEAGGKKITLHGQPSKQKSQQHVMQPTASQSSVKTLLEEFFDLFQEPTGLPPIRACAHHICMFPDVGQRLCGLIGTHTYKKMRSKSSVQKCCRGESFSPINHHFLLQCYWFESKMALGDFASTTGNSTPTL